MRVLREWWGDDGVCQWVEAMSYGYIGTMDLREFAGRLCIQ